MLKQDVDLKVEEAVALVGTKVTDEAFFLRSSGARVVEIVLNQVTSSSKLFGANLANVTVKDLHEGRHFSPPLFIYGKILSFL